MIQQAFDLLELFEGDVADHIGEVFGVGAAFERHQRVGVVVTSGKAGPQPGDLSPKAKFLFKPYRTEALVRTVREMAQRKSG